MGCHAATNGVHHQFGNIDKQGILRRDGVSTRRTPRCTHHPCHHQNARCASSHDHPTVRSYVRALQIRQIKGTPSPSVTWRGRSDGVEKCPPDLNPPAVRQPGNHEDLNACSLSSLSSLHGQPYRAGNILAPLVQACPRPAPTRRRRPAS